MIGYIVAVGADTSRDRSLFGGSIRRRRQELGLSQEALAHRVGLDRTYVSSVERGERNPGLENILRLAEGLDVPPSRLFEPWE